MKNRNAVMRKLEGIESNISKINFNLNQSNREECYSLVEEIKEQLDQVKLYIESEPISGGELN